MQSKQPVFVFIVFTLACIFIIGCGKPMLQSKWREREIVIDGKFNDWQNDMAYYDERTRVNVGFINDDTFLYICLITRNQGLAEQLMGSGFTVWLDPQGGSEKVFGIRFPFHRGMQDNNMPPRARGREDRMPADKKGSQEPPEVFQEPWQEIEIVGPGREERYATTIETTEKDGLTVKIGRSKGYFVYELKVPLIENEKHPYAIGVNKQGLIGIGFETSGIGGGVERGMGLPGAGGAGRGGMRTPGGGVGGMPYSDDGMGFSGGRGGMPEGQKNFQLWLIVMLSSGGAR